MQKDFGGSDFDNVYSVFYSESTGLVLQGSTQSRDGDFVIIDGKTRSDFLACVDTNLAIRWVLHAGKSENFIAEPLISGSDGIFVLLYRSESAENPFNTWVMCVDRDGRIKWKKQRDEDYRGRTIKELRNEKTVLNDLELEPQTICPTKDGGFIVMSSRVKKGVPQPPIISLIWYDTELTVMKYGSEFQLEWRKTYDQYKDQMGTDYAWPQKDGSILVE